MIDKRLNVCKTGLHALVYFIGGIFGFGSRGRLVIFSLSPNSLQYSARLGELALQRHFLPDLIILKHRV